MYDKFASHFQAFISRSSSGDSWPPPRFSNRDKMATLYETRASRSSDVDVRVRFDPEGVMANDRQLVLMREPEEVEEEEEEEKNEGVLLEAFTGFSRSLYAFRSSSAEEEV